MTIFSSPWNSSTVPTRTFLIDFRLFFKAITCAWYGVMTPMSSCWILCESIFATNDLIWGKKSVFYISIIEHCAGNDNSSNKCKEIVPMLLLPYFPTIFCSLAAHFDLQHSRMWFRRVHHHLYPHTVVRTAPYFWAAPLLDFLSQKLLVSTLNRRIVYCSSPKYLGWNL